MTMVREDRRLERHPRHEIDLLRTATNDLRSVMSRIDAVLDRMEEEQDQEDGGNDAGRPQGDP